MKGDYKFSVPAGGATRIFHPDEGLPLSGFDNNMAGAINTTKSSRWGPPLKSEFKDGDDTKTAPKKLGKNARKKAARKAAQTVAKKEKKEFYCEACNKYCSSQKSLEQHKRTPKHKKLLLGPLPYYCDTCNKSFETEEGFEGHKRGEKHKKRLKHLQQQNQDSADQHPGTNNDTITSSLEPDQQLVSDDSSQSGNVNWNEMYNEQFHDNNHHARIAEANREWSRANSQVEESQSIIPNMLRLEPDECPSTNQFVSGANNVDQTQTNSKQYAQTIAEPEESHDDKHNTDVSKSNGNLMKLTPEQSHQTNYPQGCHVIYSYEQDLNDSDDILVRIGTVHAVYIDMSYSRQLVYEIKPNTSSPEAMVFAEEHVLAFAPQCPILFHTTLSESSASLKDDAKVLEGIVLASQWSIVKLSYTVLLQHRAAGEYNILKTNVSGENLSYRPSNNSRP